MRSRTTIQIDASAYGRLMIFGAIVVASIVFLSDGEIHGQPTATPEPTPTQIAAELDQYARDIQNNLVSAKDQVAAQLQNLQSQLPSVDEFMESQGLRIQPTALPIIVPLPTIAPLPTQPPALPTIAPTTPPPVVVEPTPITVPQSIGSVIKIDGVPQIMTPSGWFMNCQDLYAYYGDNVDINDYSPFTGWFRSLSQPDRKYYFNICSTSW